MMSSDVVFISYSRVDTEAAERLYHDLRKLGLQPWLDRQSLRAGERWRPTVSKVIERSRFFVALLSSKSVGRRGYLHKELAEALDVLDQLPESETFLIPVRLDECELPRRELRELNWVDIFPSWESGLRRLCAALLGDEGRAAERLNAILNWQRTEEETELVSRLFTFLEDRRILFSQLWGMVGFRSAGSIASIREIRQRLTRDLQQLPRESVLANSLRRMQGACSELLDGYDALEADIASSSSTHELISEFREVFRAELVTLSEVYEIDMYRLIPSPDALANSWLYDASEERILFSDALEDFPLLDDR